MFFRNLAGIILLLCAMVYAGTYSGCSPVNHSDARVASHNISKAADMFEIDRRIVFFNGITSDVLLTIIGKCSISDQRSQLEVTCKIDDHKYKKHFLGLSDNVSYFAEHLESSSVSTSQYKVIIKPSAMIPDLDLVTENNEFESR